MNSRYRSSPQATVAPRSGAKRTSRASLPRKWPTRVTPRARSVRRCRSRPPWWPVARMFAASRARGDGSEVTAWSRKPLASAHQTMSRPSRRRGAHGARPQERTTSRPASWSSSAIWHPDCPLPTTRIRPGGRSDGFRYPSTSIAGRPAGSVSAPGGRYDRAYVPVATTSRSARTSPADVLAMKRSVAREAAARSMRLTSTPSRTGAPDVAA